MLQELWAKSTNNQPREFIFFRHYRCQCDPGCLRMTGATAWRQIHNEEEENTMKRYALFLLGVVAVIMFAPAAFAQGTAGEAVATNWVAITSGFAMAIASAAGGYAQAKATAAACEGLARNPGAAAAIRFALILALVLIESMALYTFAIVFLKVK
jgi:F-type H+-transporting ATPase subunit c